MRCNIRFATHADMPAIIEMAERFYPRSMHSAVIPFCAESTAKSMAQVLQNGFVLIAEAGGLVVGMLGMYIAPFALNHQYRTATEAMWWVDDDSRSTGAGLQLKYKARSESKARGATIMTMSTLSTTPGGVADLLVRTGFRHAESTYFLEL